MVKEVRKIRLLFCSFRISATGPSVVLNIKKKVRPLGILSRVRQERLRSMVFEI